MEVTLGSRTVYRSFTGVMYSLRRKRIAFILCMCRMLSSQCRRCASVIPARVSLSCACRWLLSAIVRAVLMEWRASLGRFQVLCGSALWQRCEQIVAQVCSLLIVDLPTIVTARVRAFCHASPNLMFARAHLAQAQQQWLRNASPTLNKLADVDKAVFRQLLG